MTRGLSRQSKGAGLVALLSVFTLALAGCGQAASETTPTTSPDAALCDPNDVTVSDDGVVSTSEACQFPGEVLRVVAYAGASTEAFQEGVGAFLEEATGAKIEWTGTDNATAISQILASKGGEPPFDVVSAMTTDGVVSLVRADALQKLPTLENLEGFPAESIAVEGYGPGYYYYPMALCVRTDKFAEAGLDAAKGVEIFNEAALANRIGFPNAGISQWDLMMPAFAAHLGSTADDPTAVVEWLESIPGVKFWGGTSDLDQMLTDGEVWVSPYTDGRCNALADKGVPVEYVGMKLNIDGATYDNVGATASAHIVAGTPNPELAAIYVNLINTPAGILPYLRDRAFYVPTNVRTAELLAEAIPEKADRLELDLDRFYQADYDAFLPARQQWLSAWNRAFQN